MLHRDSLLTKQASDETPAAAASATAQRGRRISFALPSGAAADTKSITSSQGDDTENAEFKPLTEKQVFSTQTAGYFKQLPNF